MVSQINMPPPVLGGGISFLAEYTGDRAPYKADSEWVQRIIGSDEGAYSVFVHSYSSQYSDEPPEEEGVRIVVVFESGVEWEALGLTPVFPGSIQNNESSDGGLAALPPES